MLRKLVASAAFVVMAGIAPAANASVTLHFAEASGALNGPSGPFGTTSLPVVLDFTISSPLVASHSYSFGDANVENGASGNVTDFTISAGTASSVIKYADLPHYEYFGNNFATTVRLGFDTDANANITSYDLYVGGRSDADSSVYLLYHLQDYAFDRFAPSITASSFPISSTGGLGRISGSLQCSYACGASFAVLPPASAVPEPQSWALLIAGFLMTGAALRRNRSMRSYAV